jgi:hypothetical protein
VSKRFKYGKQLLGNLFIHDQRDYAYRLATAVKPPKKAKFWEDYFKGDQGQTPHCVGFGTFDWLCDMLKRLVTEHTADELYYLAQRLDEYPGEDYDGSSVRGGVKALQQWGYVKSYGWIYDVNTLANTVLNTGPVIVGTNWYEKMFTPSASGRISIGGQVAGRHCYEIDGCDNTGKTPLFRIDNPWGDDWGKDGKALITWSDFARLLAEHGDVCLPKLAAKWARS